MNRNKVLVPVMLLGTLGYAGAAAGQQSFSSYYCRSGTLTVLAKTEDAFVYAIDHRGIARGMDEGKVFDNFTQRCVGSVSIVRGKASGGGYCKDVDPSSGDATLVEWTTAEKPGTGGTWRYVGGTGKWKGVSGGGTYTAPAPTRPVDDGTYQNCITVKGTFSVPKM